MGGREESEGERDEGASKWGIEGRKRVSWSRGQWGEGRE